MVNFDKIRRSTVAELDDMAARAAESYQLFLAGPFIRIDEPAEHPDNSRSSGGKLRYYLNIELGAQGHSIYLGEDTALRLLGEKHYGAHGNAVIHERHYIKKHLDAVIILPSSPGSFCEIGDWASDDKICQNMLMIIDKKHENKANYINHGIVKFAQKNRATIQFIQYEEKLEVLNACMQFIDEVAERRRIDELYDRK